MELETKLAELTKKIKDHKEVLLTEEAAKNALVMPFLQALGYNVFDPAEVVPEFTCDVGTKKGEKVDYAICMSGKVDILIECKPASTELSIKHASQLFRYFSTTEAKLAILTNGVKYKFFSDIDSPNKMDEKPFFTLDLNSVRKAEIKTLSRFTKSKFDVDQILEEAGKLKTQSLVYQTLQYEFQDPSEEFVKLIANKVHPGRLTQQVKDKFKNIIIASVSSLIRDGVNERLTTALSASNPQDAEDGSEDSAEGAIQTSEDEVSGFQIIRAIAAQKVDPKRIVMRDAKSYCAVLLDDNNRKAVARMHFNSATVRYLGTFSEKDETRVQVEEPLDIYKHSKAILKRLDELLVEN